MIHDRDIWAMALVILTRDDADATLEAAARTQEILAAVDLPPNETWRRIFDVVERLQATAPTEGELIQ